MRGFRPTQHLSYDGELDIDSRVYVISWSPRQAASKLPQASEDANVRGQFEEECLAFNGCNKLSILEETSSESRFQEQQPEDMNIIKSGNYDEQDAIGSLQAAHLPDTEVTLILILILILCLFPSVLQLRLNYTDGVNTRIYNQSKMAHGHS